MSSSQPNVCGHDAQGPSSRGVLVGSILCPSSSLPSVIGVGGGVVEAGSSSHAPMRAHCSIGQGAPSHALMRARYSNGQGDVNSRREGPSPSLTKQSAFQDQCMPMNLHHLSFDWDPGSPLDDRVTIASHFSLDPMLLEASIPPIVAR
jgi:hypothetical protein